MRKLWILFLLTFICTTSESEARFRWGSGFDEADFNLGENSVVFHEKDSNPPTPVTDEIALFSKDDSGTTKLYQIDSSGTVSAVGSGSSGLTISTTTITGGTDTRVLFDDAGVLGEDAGFTYVKGTDALTVVGATTIGGLTTANASLNIANGATSSGILKILEDTDAGSNFATFQVPSLSSNTVYTLPSDDGDTDQVLSTNGSGTLDWVAAGLTIGTTAITSGTDTRVLFDDGGVVGEDAGFTYVKVTDTLTVASRIASGASGSIQFIDTSTSIPLSNAGSGYPYISYNLTQTPDALTIAPGSLSNGIVMHQYDDSAFDFAHAQQTNPTLFIHSAAQSTTQWMSLTHDGTNGLIDVGAGGIKTNDQLIVLQGTDATPSILFAGNLNHGFYESTANLSIVVSKSGAAYAAINSNTYGFVVKDQWMFSFAPSTDPTATPDVMLIRGGAAVLMLGGPNSATPVNQTFQATGGSGTDIAGGNLTIAAGKGTGAGAPGDLLFQTSDVLGTGTTLQTLATRALINDVGKLIIGTSDATTFGGFQWNATQTVDTNMLLTGSTSNHWVFAESADSGFDFAHGQATNPTLFIHSATQGTTEWISVSHNQTNGLIDVGAGSISIPDGLILDATTEANIEAGLDLAGEVTATDLDSTVIGDSITVTGWVMGASTATTASVDDNDTSLATTAFVNAEIADDLDTSAELAGVLTDEIGSSSGFAVFSNSPAFVDDIDLGAAGVRLLGADGVLTVTGLGNGNDENLTFDFDNGTSDEVDIASGTSAGQINWTGIFRSASLQIDLITTGVSLDTDGDGMLIMAGTGNGADEDLRFNFDDGVGGANSVEITSGTSATDIDTNLNIRLAENTSIVLDAALSADGKYTSTATEVVTAGETIAFGDVVYLKAADSQWYLTDADADASAGAVRVAIAVTTGTDNNPVTIMKSGKIRADANFPALTVGAPVYISTDAGNVQTAQPSGTDDVIRIVGYGNTGDEMDVSISNDYITHT